MTDKASERERVRSTVGDLIYARVGGTNAAEGASVDITYFILHREQSLKQEHERALNIIEHDVACLLRIGESTGEYNSAINDAIEIINRLRGRK